MDGIDLPTEFLLVRHAQSEWNAAGRWQGHADPPLSPLGHAQAQKLALHLEGELRNPRCHRILCSDLERAHETARIIGRPFDLPPEIDAHLREIDVGDWSGLTREEIALRDPNTLARFETGELDVRPGGGETRRELQSRARTWVMEIARAAPGKRIVLVTHLGFIRALRPDAKPENADFIWLRIRPEESSDPSVALNNVE
jgi:broad specificity phosphatase PhoE